MMAASGATDDHPFNNRRALIICNGVCENPPLSNPGSDATDLSGVLGTVGFKVTLGYNLDVRHMRLTDPSLKRHDGRRPLPTHSVRRF